MRSSRGWSLVEILVVIAIIAVLAAILFPVFARAREKARQTSCLSNLKQLATAATLYSDDYDGYHTRGQFAPFTGVHTWLDAIEPYLKNEQVAICPTARRTDDLPHSYGYNIAWWGAGDVPDGMHGIQDRYPVHQSNVREPSETLWMVDFERYWGCGLEFGVEEPTWRHNEGANAAFVDGHAKWYKELEDRVWTVNVD
ncbi:MAG: DUF1559 domain-containing protein [Armatimonadia bacterium]|nr:DUF1559 domain-containing protein [Armatimonadia bacterium]